MIIFPFNIISTILILNFLLLICGSDLESDSGYTIIENNLDLTSNLYNITIMDINSKETRHLTIPQSYTEQLLDDISNQLISDRKLYNINRSFFELCNEVSLRNFNLEDVIIDLSRSSYTESLKFLFYRRILFFYNTVLTLIEASTLNCGCIITNHIIQSKFGIDDIYPILSPRLLCFSKQIHKFNLKSQKINLNNKDNEDWNLLDNIFSKIEVPEFYTNTLMYKKMQSIVKYAISIRRCHIIDDFLLLRYCSHKISLIENEVEKFFIRIFLINHNFYKRKRNYEKLFKLLVFLKLTYFSEKTNKDFCLSDHNLAKLLLNKKYKQTYFYRFLFSNNLLRLKSKAVNNDRYKKFTEQLVNFYLYFGPYIKLQEDYSDFKFIENCFFQNKCMPLVMIFLTENYIQIYKKIYLE